jgi:hypothetical protein
MLKKYKKITKNQTFVLTEPQISYQHRVWLKNNFFEIRGDSVKKLKEKSKKKPWKSVFFVWKPKNSSI